MHEFFDQKHVLNIYSFMLLCSQTKILFSSQTHCGHTTFCQVFSTFQVGQLNKTIQSKVFFNKLALLQDVITRKQHKKVWLFCTIILMSRGVTWYTYKPWVLLLLMSLYFFYYCRSIRQLRHLSRYCQFFSVYKLLNVLICSGILLSYPDYQYLSDYTLNWI